MAGSNCPSLLLHVNVAPIVEKSAVSATCIAFMKDAPRSIMDRQDWFHWTMPVLSFCTANTPRSLLKLQVIPPCDRKADCNLLNTICAASSSTLSTVLLLMLLLLYEWLLLHRITSSTVQHSDIGTPPTIVTWGINRGRQRHFAGGWLDIMSDWTEERVVRKGSGGSSQRDNRFELDSCIIRWLVGYLASAVLEEASDVLSMPLFSER